MQDLICLPTPERPLVLIVEDEPLLRCLLAEVLEDEGYCVLEAADVMQALKQLEAHPNVQLVFTDIQLPGAIDGLDLLRIVNLRWPHVQLMATSGRLAPHLAELPSEALFIAKPYQERDMLRQIHTLLA